MSRSLSTYLESSWNYRDVQLRIHAERDADLLIVQTASFATDLSWNECKFGVLQT